MGLDVKELKKIAETCRKVGINYFKNESMEFTLTSEPPVSNYKKRKVEKEASAPVIDDSVKSDSLTEEALLLWSSVDPTDESAK